MRDLSYSEFREQTYVIYSYFGKIDKIEKYIKECNLTVYFDLEKNKHNIEHIMDSIITIFKKKNKPTPQSLLDKYAEHINDIDKQMYIYLYKKNQEPCELKNIKTRSSMRIFYIKNKMENILKKEIILDDLYDDLFYITSILNQYNMDYDETKFNMNSIICTNKKILAEYVKLYDILKDSLLR